jgi:DNA topoisomerase III, bacteria and conjugative plasmid
MESAGSEDAPEDAERKGLGTPATRAGILEKLVKTGYVEWKKAKSAVHLLPTHKALSLITVVPEAIQSPKLTAEWESRLKEIERGQLAPEDFMAEITHMVRELVDTYEMAQDGQVLLTSPRKPLAFVPAAAVGFWIRPRHSLARQRIADLCSGRTAAFLLQSENR